MVQMYVRVFIHKTYTANSSILYHKETITVIFFIILLLTKYREIKKKQIQHKESMSKRNAYKKLLKKT